MAKLVKFKDGKFVCWSRVDLDNGEPIWISVARTGVMVKKSRWGWCGEKLYNGNVYEANQAVLALVRIYLHDGIPEEYDALTLKMTNHLLVIFTLEAMLSESAFQLSTKLNSDLNALADDITLADDLQFMERVKKFGNRVLEPFNEQADKSEGNSKTYSDKFKEKS